jgi:ChrR Cupin-like domain
MPLPRPELPHRLAALPLGTTWLGSTDASYSSRLVKLAVGETVEFAEGCKDIYVIAGRISSGANVFNEGAYFGLNDVVEIVALAPTVIFVFSCPGPDREASCVLANTESAFRQGRNPGIRRYDLRTRPYHVAIVDFAPGTHIPAHSHPRGEEIYILSGELFEAPVHLAQHAWHRVLPAEMHSPIAHDRARILLFTNHLIDDF